MPENAVRYRPSAFRPAWWLPGAHAQTVAGRFIRPVDEPPLRKQRIELPDGDFLDLHHQDGDFVDDAPVALILHGLEGSSASNYMATVAADLAARGIRPVRMNFRGCSGEMNRHPRFYHAGETGDLLYILRVLGAEAGAAKVGAVGFSLGGNILLKFLADVGEQASDFLSAAVAVSVPFDLAAGTRRLEQRGMGWLYSRYFIRKLRRKAMAKREILLGHCDVDRAIGSRTIREYDDHITARLHDFRDAWDYYDQCSSAGVLDRIRIPTLILHSLDDPFLPAASVPADGIRNNPWLVDGVTECGGHVGFIAGSPLRPEFWAEREAAEFLRAQLQPAGSNVHTTKSSHPLGTE